MSLWANACLLVRLLAKYLLGCRSVFSMHRSPQQPQQLYRVRDAATRKSQPNDRDAKDIEHTTTPVGLNNSAFPTAQSGAAMPRREGKSSKPFLEELFEDLRGADDRGGADQSAHQGSEFSDSRLPLNTYAEQLRRQVAKPNILQFCVSTDAVPLLSTTGPVNYTWFDETKYVRPEDPQTSAQLQRRRRIFAGMHAAADMRRARDASTLPGAPLWKRPVVGGDGGVDGGAQLSGGHQSSFYNEEEELQSAHLRFLLSTIEQTKRTMGSATVRRPHGSYVL